MSLIWSGKVLSFVLESGEGEWETSHCHVSLYAVLELAVRQRGEH